MKLENVQIEIKNKEHYEAVKKRLQELGKWVWHNADGVELQAKEKRYEMTISKVGGKPLFWGSLNGAETITLDDLYEVKKEKVVRERFRVYDATFDYIGTFDDREDAVEFIKEQKVGAYEIRPYYEVAEK